MTGRASVFADPEVIRLAATQFIAVTADDWYQRRRDDSEGRFWRQVADQGPRKGTGGSTCQGIYCFTADGKLLSYRNPHDPAVMREKLREALREWHKLPAERRQPGAVTVADAGTPDARYARVPPPAVWWSTSSRASSTARRAPTARALALAPAPTLRPATTSG